MKPLIRFLLDALYVLAFFAIMAGAAYVAHQLALFLEHGGVDPSIVWMTKQVEKIIAAFDAIGVVCGSGFSLYRFIKALIEEGNGGNGGNGGKHAA